MQFEYNAHRAPRTGRRISKRRYESCYKSWLTNSTNAIQVQYVPDGAYRTAYILFSRSYTCLFAQQSLFARVFITHNAARVSRLVSGALDLHRRTILHILRAYRPRCAHRVLEQNDRRDARAHTRRVHVKLNADAMISHRARTTRQLLSHELQDRWAPHCL